MTNKPKFPFDQIALDSFSLTRLRNSVSGAGSMRPGLVKPTVSAAGSVKTALGTAQVNSATTPTPTGSLLGLPRKPR